MEMDYPYKKLNTDQISFKKIISHSLKMGLTSFGGPVAHIGLFTNYLVKEMKIISEEKFLSFLSICNILPGPTSSQLITTIYIWKSNSIKGGMASFFGFNFPGLIIILITATILKDFEGKYHSNELISSILYGIWQAATALVIQAGINLSRKLINSKFQLLLILVSFLLYSFFNNYYIMIILMVFCGTFSFLKNEDGQMLNFDLETNFKEISFLGFPSLILWGFIYLLLMLGSIFTNIWVLSTMEKFYRIGSFIIGGGHVVIPMILSEFENLNKSDIYNAFSIVSLLPGPMFNMAGYIGTVMGGIIVGFLSAIFLFLPGFLLLFGGLGFLEKIKDHKRLQIFLKGVGSASIGFIFSASLLLWVKSCFLEKTIFKIILSSLNVGLCFFLIEKRKINILIVYLFSIIFSIIINMVI